MQFTHVHVEREGSVKLLMTQSDPKHGFPWFEFFSPEFKFLCKLTLFYMNINVTLFQGRSQGVERGQLPPLDSS